MFTFEMRSDVYLRNALQRLKRYSSYLVQELLGKICDAYYLPAWCSAADYIRIAKEAGLEVGSLSRPHLLLQKYRPSTFTSGKNQTYQTADNEDSTVSR
jgi:hypothetical protein